MEIGDIRERMGNKYTETKELFRFTYKDKDGVWRFLPYEFRTYVNAVQFAKEGLSKFDKFTIHEGGHVAYIRKFTVETKAENVYRIEIGKEG